MTTIRSVKPKPGDEFFSAYHRGGSVVRWRVLTEPAEEAGRGPLYVWAEPIRPLCGRRLPARAVFFVRDIAGAVIDPAVPS